MAKRKPLKKKAPQKARKLPERPAELTERKAHAEMDTVYKNRPTGQRRPCFACNGTGRMCTICGEASNTCSCEEEDQKQFCESCLGSKIAPLDMTAAEKEEGKERFKRAGQAIPEDVDE